MLKKERRANNAWHKLLRNKMALVGFIIVCLVFLMAILAPVIAPCDPAAISPLDKLKGPGYVSSKGITHWLGTDEFGRDLLSRLIYGAQISVVVAIGSTVVGGVIGILLGLIAGYKGGLVDSIIMRIMDGMFAFPFLLLAMIMVTVLGSGIQNVIIAIGVANVPSFARMVRGQVHVVKNEEYCNAARALGEGDARILFRHILPNTISPIVVYATMNMASAILSEASLSFLGLGITPPTASWGNILTSGKGYLQTAPHLATEAGLCILITVIGFNLLGDGIRDVLDPKMKK
ncbi:MAG TPA: ABC transporter permease [Firmicutes bacterium]|nr:ABC transporter permease [Bacillota bacterium]